tara:strand:+ start:904 stop:1323 length:420 start_codon:yes stop_codon:yes gene_type:complete
MIGNMKFTGCWKNGIYYYLLAQGVGGILWWCLLFLRPHYRSWFLAETLPERVLISFWLPDCLIFITGSMAAAYGYRNRRSWFPPVLYFLTGGISYVSLYCLTLSFSTHGGWPGTLVMLFCMLVMLLICLVLNSDQHREI